MKPTHYRHLVLASLVGALGFITPSAFAASTVFKCTASTGITQYAQRAISGQKCQLIRLDGTPASALEAQRLNDQRNLSRAAQSQPPDTPVTTPAGAAPAATASVEPPKPAPASPEQCAQLSQARATLEQGGRVYETDDKGERSYITEDQRKARLAEYQNTAKTRCP